ncbi:flagellar protein FliT [Pseudomonas sp. WN033]|nr:flagellar protein FliT [Pseudomonas sp. WN033]
MIRQSSTKWPGCCEKSKAVGMASVTPPKEIVMAQAVKQLQQTHEALIAAVRAGDWEQVGELDKLCRQQVAQAMEQPERDDQMVVDTLDGLLATYREVIGLCQAVQGKLAEELQGMQRGKAGAKVYQMFS